jgi:hypothetical protein
VLLAMKPKVDCAFARESRHCATVLDAAAIAKTAAKRSLRLPERASRSRKDHSLQRVANWTAIVSKPPSEAAHDEMCRLDNDNIEVSKAALGPGHTLISDVYTLYDTLSDWASDSDLDREFSTMFHQYVLACHRHAIFGFVTILRAHITEMFINVRMAIECCGFAVRLYEHPHLMKDWLNQDDDIVSYRTFLTKFRSKVLRKSTVEGVAELFDEYDTCAKMCHPSLLAFSRILKLRNGPLRINLYDPGPPDGRDMRLYFIWAVGVHMKIAKVLAKIIRRKVGRDSERWMQVLSTAEARFEHYRQLWDPRSGRRFP